MAYPDDYSAPTGVIGSTLQTPSHIGAHQAIADWIAAAEPHIGLAKGTWTPVFRDNGTTLGSGHSGRYRRIGNDVFFDISMNGPLSFGATGFRDITLPFDMIAGADAGWGGTWITKQGAGSTFVEQGHWIASRVIGIGNNRLRLQNSPNSFLDNCWVSGRYEAV